MDTFKFFEESKARTLSIKKFYTFTPFLNFHVLSLRVLGLCGFRIRRMRPQDVVEVVRIANQAFLETARLTRRLGYGFAKYMLEGGELLFVAETEGGKVVGFVFGRREEDSAVIGWIAVHPEYQGRGIGGLLLKAVEDKARRTGLKTVITGTPFARSFYEKYGYECYRVERALLLELIGRTVKPPRDLDVRPLLLDDLPALASFMGDEEYLRFLMTYFSVYDSDPDMCLIGFRGKDVAGAVVGKRNEVYPDLVTLEELVVKDESHAYDMLDALTYAVSVKGYRWVGVRLPVRGLDEEELLRKGWKDAKLPSFWTRYHIRKHLR